MINRRDQSALLSPLLLDYPRGVKKSVKKLLNGQEQRRSIDVKLRERG